MHGNVNLFDPFLDYVLDVLPNYLHFVYTFVRVVSVYFSVLFIFSFFVL